MLTLRVPYDKTAPVTMVEYPPAGVPHHYHTIYAVGARLCVHESGLTGTITWMHPRAPVFRMRIDHERQDRVFAQGGHTFSLVGYKAPAD